VSGLAHIFEQQGLSTVMVGLIPQHVARMRPPRALVVPFELGRPFGAPNQPALQSEVLEATLDLLQQASSPPFVAEFDTAIEVPTSEEQDSEGWACPISLPAPEMALDPTEQLLEEVRLLQPWYDRGRRDRGHSAVGASGLEIREIVRWLATLAGDVTMPSEDPGRDGNFALRLKLAVEDLKAFYLEAATAQPGPTSSKAAFDWFWKSTLAAELLRRLRDALSQDEDPLVRLYAGATLVPSLRP